MCDIICRTCANAIDPLDMKDSVHITEQLEIEDVKVTLSDALRIFALIQIKPNDSLPKVVCNNCKLRATDAYSFWKMCINSERKLFKASETNIAVKEEPPDEETSEFNETKEIVLEDPEVNIPNVPDFPPLQSSDEGIKTFDKAKETVPKDSELDTPDSIKEYFGNNKPVPVQLQKRKRGRPKKTAPVQLLVQLQKRKRGRPKKTIKEEYICQSCGMAFTTNSILNEHIKIIHLNVNIPDTDFSPLQSSVEGKIESDQTKESVPKGSELHTPDFSPLELSHEENISIKEYFGDNKPVPAQLQKRKRGRPKKTVKEEYVCESCGMAFTANSQLNEHIKITHLNVKPFSCQESGQSFPLKHLLKSHEEIHTNNKGTNEFNEMKEIIQEEPEVNLPDFPPLQSSDEGKKEIDKSNETVANDSEFDTPDFSPLELSDEENTSIKEGYFGDNKAVPAQTQKRKRGRPKKIAPVQLPKRKRGRPKKTAKEECEFNETKEFTLENPEVNLPDFPPLQSSNEGKKESDKAKETVTNDSEFDTPDFSPLELSDEENTSIKEYFGDNKPAPAQLPKRKPGRPPQNTPKEKYLCESCGMLFSKNYYLNDHIKYNHLKVKPFSCQECGKSFPYKHLLKYHEEMHSNKVYQCDQCGKTFSTILRIRGHMMYHKNAGRFKCTQCKATFAKANSLKKHQTKHTQDRSFICVDCGKRFNRKENLHVHKTVHTGEKPFLCNVCGKSFRLKTSLLFHTRTHHLKGTSKQSKEES